MDLKKMVEDVEIYSDIYEELYELIDIYINKYKLCKSKYDTKKDLWIRSLFEEFKEVYEKLGFEVKEEEKKPSFRYEKDTYLEYVAKYKNLEFELMATGVSDIYKNIRFLQTKPASSAFNFELDTNIKMYKIDFQINDNNRYNANKLNIFSIDKVEKIKKDLEETKYNVDEMKSIISLIRCEEEKLERNLKEIEEKDFTGYIYKDKERIQFTSLYNLIELL